MTITAIILAHFKEREANLPKIVDNLLAGTIKPDKIIVFIDNPAISFSYNSEQVIAIYSSTSFKPNIRFALGTICETDYCFFIDDDLSVKPKTLENFVTYAAQFPDAILGLQGSILGNTATPYSNDRCINRGTTNIPLEVDIIIRTYFVPVVALLAGLALRNKHNDLPKESLDDVFLCLGNKYVNGKQNLVIPVNEETDLIELSEGGVGQSRQGEHYNNRNIVCRFLMDKYGR